MTPPCPPEVAAAVFAEALDIFGDPQDPKRLEIEVTAVALRLCCELQMVSVAFGFVARMLNHYALEGIRALPVARRALAGDLEQLVDKVDLRESWNVWCCINTMGTCS
jgi:hypothetical protein